MCSSISFILTDNPQTFRVRVAEIFNNAERIEELSHGVVDVVVVVVEENFNKEDNPDLSRRQSRLGYEAHVMKSPSLALTPLYSLLCVRLNAANP